MPAGSQCAKATFSAANTTTTLTTIRAATASSRAAAAATHIANTMNVAAKHSSSPATSKARLHAPAAACRLAAAAHCARPSIQKSMFLTLLVVVSLCANCAVSSPMQLQQQQQQPEQQQQQQQQQSTIRVQQCREGCFEKFATKEMLCQQNAECLTCWDECAKPPPPKINKSIRETWSLHTVSMLQQDSLVLVDVAWAPLSTPNQCLVTWEVSGGGLMGNLLTESFNVQLSLWPDTKYRVQVTCKNKLTGTMSRSLPLTIDTAEAVSAPVNIPQQKQPSTISNATPSGKHLPTAHIIDSHGNNIVTNDDAIDDMNAALPAAADAQDIASVLPYEEDDLGAASDQSAETISQHTNFIFNWHAKNSDISAIEPLQKPDLNILTLAALSDMQKPLLFGVVAGTLLLVFVLLMYVCMMRQQRLPGDKAALIAEDAHAVVVSLPPAAAAALAATASTSANAATMCYSDEGCRNPAICSRNALKV